MMADTNNQLHYYKCISGILRCMKVIYILHTAFYCTIFTSRVDSPCEDKQHLSK